MKAKTKFLLLLTSSIICLPLFICPLKANDKNSITAWLSYWDIKNGTPIINNSFIDKIDELYLFFYAFDKDKNLINAFKDQNEYNHIIGLLTKKQINIIPSITNDIINAQSGVKLKDPDLIHQILKNEDLRKKHILDILGLIKSLNAGGVDIDYENMYAKDKGVFTQFIKELSTALHSEDKILNVTVQQKTEGHNRNGPGAIDWKEISQYADKIIIMCYNYSSKASKPGPISPSFWLEDTIKFAKSQIPKDKICIALALYGYDWSKEKTNSLNLKTANAIIKNRKPKLNWDKKSSSPNFLYYSNGQKHEVWFENEKSLLDKINIIKKYKIKNLALWHLSILDSSLMKPLKTFLEE